MRISDWSSDVCSSDLRDDHQAFLTNETSYKACPTPPNPGVASTRQRQAPDNPSQERPLARRTGARDTLHPTLLWCFSPCCQSTANSLTISATCASVSTTDRKSTRLNSSH